MLTIECGQPLELRDVAWDVGFASFGFGALCFMEHEVSDHIHDMSAIETHVPKTNQSLADFGRPLFSNLLFRSEKKRLEQAVFFEVIPIQEVVQQIDIVGCNPRHDLITILVEVPEAFWPESVGCRARGGE